MTTDRAGISSACFYPLETELSLKETADCGTKVCELFMNSPSELEDDFIDELLGIKQKNGLDIVSMHPYGSFTESYTLFSSYGRRFSDYIPLYRKFFSAAEKLGCGIFVVHGAKLPGSVDDDTYCERFSKMIDIAAEYGVIFAHENVVHYRSESPAYLEMMRKNIGGKFRTVLDIKQAYRAGFSPYEFTERLADSIVHVHISDRNDEKDCIPPGRGVFGFDAFFAHMKEIGYDGKFIIELYNHSYNGKEEIITAYDYVSGRLNDVYGKG